MFVAPTFIDLYFLRFIIVKNTSFSFTTCQHFSRRGFGWGFFLKEQKSPNDRNRQRGVRDIFIRSIGWLMLFLKLTGKRSYCLMSEER